MADSGLAFKSGHHGANGSINLERPPAKAYQHTLMSCVLNGAKSFDSLFEFANFGGHVDTGKSSACCPVMWDGGGKTILLFSVYKDRWRSDDNASLRRHPIYVARTVQQFFADLPPSYGISACLPLAAAEANINLTALKQQPAIGQPMRKFLSEQLKDKNDVKKTYRVRLAVFEKAHYNDFYKWCRSQMWGEGASGGFEGFRKLIFEITWALSVTQSLRPGFKHNDLHAANVLITADAVGMEALRHSEASTMSGSATYIGAAGSAAAAGGHGGGGGGGYVTPTSSLPQLPLGGPAGGSPGANLAGTSLALYSGRPHYRYSFPAKGIEFAVPAWPGVINQKVVDFEAEDSVWGVCTTRDDMYDLFMLSYHLYITHFEQLLERNTALLGEIFQRCRAIYRVLAHAAPNDRGVYRNLARNVLAAGGGFVAGVNPRAVEAGMTDLTEEDREELSRMYHVGHINDLRTYHLTRDQMERLWAPQRDLQQFLEWVVPHRFFGMTDKELVPEGIHRWRYNDTAVKGGLLSCLKTPTEALLHPYFAPYVAAATELTSLANRGGGAGAVPGLPLTAAHYTHPMGGGAGGGGGGGNVASAPSSLLMGPPAQSLVAGALPLGLTSPGRGGAGAGGGVGMTLPLQLPLHGAQAVQHQAGYTLGAGADTARAHYGGGGHHAPPHAAHP